MRDQEQWGPWIEHDGQGTPSAIKPGMIHRVEGVYPKTGELLRTREAVATPHLLEPKNWTWDATEFDILRFQIRKPRGLTILEECLDASIGVPKREGQDA